jgi:hypothetical protein
MVTLSIHPASESGQGRSQPGKCSQAIVRRRRSLTFTA